MWDMNPKPLSIAHSSVSLGSLRAAIAVIIRRKPALPHMCMYDGRSYGNGHSQFYSGRVGADGAWCYAVGVGFRIWGTG